MVDRGYIKDDNTSSYVSNTGLGDLESMKSLTDINSKSLAKAGITVDIIIICFYSCRQDGNSYLTL